MGRPRKYCDDGRAIICDFFKLAKRLGNDLTDVSHRLSRVTVGAKFKLIQYSPAYPLCRAVAFRLSKCKRSLRSVSSIGRGSQPDRRKFHNPSGRFYRDGASL
ncbi:hypothetical protein BaRGS_00007448 [Batillaria attramentaria]|uniref:Uncharacterized protein n=1 Tax=Batillaria attramentaria TaxID=370345 RepID=A0ABD0LPB7_9CAEN